MIVFLKGILVSVDVDTIVLDVAGIGYGVTIPKNAINSLPPLGNSMQLHTYLNVRDDGAALFGFITKEELNLFKKLISVSGIGPRVAINIIGATEPNLFTSALFNEDIKYLTKLPGVGKKTAQRLILDLKDKLEPLSSLLPEGRSLAAYEDKSFNDALDALMGLGYQRQEVISVLMTGKKALGDAATVQDLIKFTLKGLGKSGRG